MGFDKQSGVAETCYGNRSQILTLESQVDTLS